jgi:S1-C subfamily serine protease
MITLKCSKCQTPRQLAKIIPNSMITCSNCGIRLPIPKDIPHSNDAKSEPRPASPKVSQPVPSGIQSGNLPRSWISWAFGPPDRSTARRRRRLIILGSIGAIILVAVVTTAIVGTRQKPIHEPSVDEPTQKVQNLSSQELLAKCEPAVARVQHRFGTGSGFLIQKPGVLVTNSHVVSGDLIDNIKLTFPSARTDREHEYRAKMVYEDRKRDLAVLQLSDMDSPPAISPLVLTTQSVAKLDDVIVLGSPGVDQAGTVSSNAVGAGKISNVDFILDDLKFLHVDVTVNHGNSGGPLLNIRGEVIGVAVASIRGKQNMNLFIPWQDVQIALEKASRATQGDIERVCAEQKLTEVTERLLVTSRAYYVALDYFEDVKIDALKKKSDSSVIRSAWSKLASLLEADRGLHFDPVADIFAKTISSHDLPSTSQGDRDILALRDLYIEMKNTFDMPDININTLAERRKDYGERLNKVTERLKLKLGIDPKGRYLHSKVIVSLDQTPKDR